MPLRCRSLVATLTFCGGTLLVYAARAAEPTKDECISANEAAQDLRAAGKLREARQQLALCVASTCPHPVRADCAQRLADVESAMPTLVLEARDEANNDLAAVMVESDGQPLVSRLDGTPVAIDPGQHVLTFRTAGRPIVQKTIVVREGDKARHERVSLGPIPPVPSIATSSSSPADPRINETALGDGTAVVAKVAETPTSVIPVLDYLAFGVGAAGVIVGIASGIAGESKHAALEGECRSTGECPASAQGDIDGFHTLRTASTIGYVVGSVGVAGGIFLWLVEPKGPTTGASTRVWIGPNSAGLRGAF